MSDHITSIETTCQDIRGRTKSAEFEVTENAYGPELRWMKPNSDVARATVAFDFFDGQMQSLVYGKGLEDPIVSVSYDGHGKVKKIKVSKEFMAMVEEWK